MRRHRVRYAVERWAARLHAAEEVAARERGWTVHRTPWGGRVYRDPRLDALRERKSPCPPMTPQVFSESAHPLESRESDGNEFANLPILAAG